MNMVNVILPSLILVGASTLVFTHNVRAESLYKCIDSDGAVAYQATRCAGPSEQERIRTAPAPSRDDVEQAVSRLNDMQTEINRRSLENTATPNEQFRPQTSNESASKDCSDIRIFNYSLFNKDVISGGTVTGGVVTGGVVIGGALSGATVNTKRCANIAFELKGYGSRINDKEYANKIASKFVAHFMDGGVRTAVSGKINSGSRIHLGQTYFGSFCFGSNNFEIIDLQCR